MRERSIINRLQVELDKVPHNCEEPRCNSIGAELGARAFATRADMRVALVSSEHYGSSFRYLARSLVIKPIQKFRSTLAQNIDAIASMFVAYSAPNLKAPSPRNRTPFFRNHISDSLLSLETTPDANQCKVCSDLICASCGSPSRLPKQLPRQPPP